MHNIKDRLIFALDGFTDIDSAKKMANALGDAVTFYKLGMELLMTGQYFEVFDWLKDQDKKIFVDLKFFDVPRTVAAAIEKLSDKGATFATIHGNDAILKAACEVRGELDILAVTALTSLDKQDMLDLGFDCNIEQLVLSRAKRALDCGCAGVVSSGLEVKALRQAHPEAKALVVPGIRPVNNDDDQKRTVDVPTAFANGASHIVVGRPIHHADDPRGAALAMQAQIAQLFD